MTTTPPCCCCCCAHRRAGFGDVWCAHPEHPNPPRTAAETMAERDCPLWEPERATPQPGMNPPWLDALLLRAAQGE